MNTIKITISGKICTGKSTLFRSLTDYFKCKGFSVGMYFRDYANQHNLDINNAEEQTDKITRQVDKNVRNILLQNKSIIIEGSYSAISAQNIPNVIKILLIADKTVRVKRYMTREKTTKKEAIEKINQREKSLKDKFNTIYGINNVFLHKYYDTIINTTTLSPEEIVSVVLNKINYESKKCTSNKRK